MPDSDVVRNLRAFREAMNAQEEETTRDLGNRWLAMERRLNSSMIALAADVDRLIQQGQEPTIAMIKKMERYQALQVQMIAEIEKYNIDAARIITNSQTAALTLGIDAAQNAITTMLGDTAGAGAFDRINIQAVNSMIGFAGDGSPLSDLLKNDYDVAADGMLQALINGVGLGQSAADTARDMAQGFGMGMDRALLIARTELNRSYRAGSVQQYRDSGVVVKFKRLVARDEACLACLALDGEIFDTADEMDDHPNGRCTCVPVLVGMPAPEWDTAQDWFAEQDEARQLEILGPGRFELYKNGMPIQDMARKVHNDTWGASPAIIPLKDLE